MTAEPKSSTPESHIRQLFRAAVLATLSARDEHVDLLRLEIGQLKSALKDARGKSEELWEKTRREQSAPFDVRRSLTDQLDAERQKVSEKDEELISAQSGVLGLVNLFSGYPKVSEISETRLAESRTDLLSCFRWKSMAEQSSRLHLSEKVRWDSVLGQWQQLIQELKAGPVPHESSEDLGTSKPEDDRIE